jgi:hypothetical protein
MDQEGGSNLLAAWCAKSRKNGVARLISLERRKVFAFRIPTTNSTRNRNTREPEVPSQSSQHVSLDRYRQDRSTGRTQQRYLFFGWLWRTTVQASLAPPTQYGIRRKEEGGQHKAGSLRGPHPCINARRGRAGAPRLAANCCIRACCMVDTVFEAASRPSLRLVRKQRPNRRGLFIVRRVVVGIRCWWCASRRPTLLSCPIA